MTIFKNLRPKNIHSGFVDPYANLTGDIFVDFTNGSDSNSGTSDVSPVKSIHQATTLCPNNGTIAILPKEYVISSPTAFTSISNENGNPVYIYDGLNCVNGKTITINGNNALLNISYNFGTSVSSIFSTYNGTGSTFHVNNFNIISQANTSNGSGYVFSLTSGSFTNNIYFNNTKFYNHTSNQVYTKSFYIGYSSSIAAGYFYVNSGEFYNINTTYSNDYDFCQNQAYQTHLQVNSNDKTNYAPNTSYYTGTPTIVSLPSITQFRTSIGY